MAPFGACHGKCAAHARCEVLAMSGAHASAARLKGASVQVMLMQSKSMPKRIHFTGSDGERYRFLAKPDDDLRRDMRVMEFASLLNRLLEGDTNTRRRDMQVLPLAHATLPQHAQSCACVSPVWAVLCSWVPQRRAAVQGMYCGRP